MTKIKWDTELARKAIIDKCGDIVKIIEPYSYTHIDHKIPLKCKEHGNFERSLYEIIKRKYPCPKCSPTGPKGWEFIKNELYKKHGNRYNYSLMDNGGYSARQPLKIICPEHGLFTQLLGEHKKGSNCPRCVAESTRKTINNFLYESISKHGNNYGYENIFEHFKTYNDKVPILCKKHGEFWQRAGDHSKGVGCPSCNQSSKGEMLIQKFLTQNGIEFVTQKTFDDFKTDKGFKYKFDFYLPTIGTLIEFDGIQHLKPTLYNQYDVENQHRIDNIKNQYAGNNGYLLLRITELNAIEDILTREILKG